MIVISSVEAIWLRLVAVRRTATRCGVVVVAVMVAVAVIDRVQHPLPLGLIDDVDVGRGTLVGQ